MPYYDSETIERARQVDLLTYLQTCEPQELVHVSGEVYCTKTHDSLRISNGKWCWFSRGIGGYSALDYLIKVNGYSFMDAMETITGRAAIVPTLNSLYSCLCAAISVTGIAKSTIRCCWTRPREPTALCRRSISPFPW